MAKELIFSGDELALLVAMDRAGCVQTDDGKFYCDLENDKLPWGSRLPVRILGTYESMERGWKIALRIRPAPRTLLIGIIFAVLFLSSLIAAPGKGTVLFGILSAAMVVNFAAQKNGCLRRFENVLLHGRDFEL